MSVYGDENIDQLFYDAFLYYLEEDPEWYEYLYGVPIDEIRANPRKYYDMDIKKKQDRQPEEPKEQGKPQFKAVGLF